MGRKEKYTMKEVEIALRDCGGFVSKTSTQLRCTRQTVWNYIKRYPELQDIREEIEETYLDMAEGKILDLIEAGNLGAICFYLKCKGKDRGYVEKQIIKSEGSLLLGEDSEYQRMKAAGEEVRAMIRRMAEGKYKEPKKIEAPVLNEGEED